MGLGDFLKTGVQKLGKAVGGEVHRLGQAVKHTAKDAYNEATKDAKAVVNVAKDVVVGGKIVAEKVKGALTSNPEANKGIDMTQFDPTDVKKAKSRGNEKHLTNQYNYAGPGTFFDARQRGSDYYEKLMNATGHKVIGTKPYNKPFNKLDSCAVIHDRAYANPNLKPAQIQQADKDFQSCIGRIAGADRQQALLIKGAQKGFSAKLKAENVGLMKKGSLSDSSSKESTSQQLGRLAKNAVKFLP
jgi:hypothetical protein